VRCRHKHWYRNARLIGEPLTNLPERDALVTFRRTGFPQPHSNSTTPTPAMARPSSPPILTQIRNSKSPTEQIVALRALKNEIIGHQQKKEMWVGLGVVEPIVRIMTLNKAQGKQNGKERYDHRFTPESLSEKEMVRLQALCVIGSLAHGEEF
jgi:hypothetical protein